jgi:hypothetical protein
MGGDHRRRRAPFWQASLVGVAIGCGPSSDGGLVAAPEEVPITVTGERFVVPIQVGDAPPFDALLDTGSWGLRVRPGVLPDSAYQATDTQVAYGYGGDLSIYGIVALARVTFGTRSTAAPIPIMIIQQSACPPDTGCDPEQVLDAHFSGLAAILGVGMRTDAFDYGIGNPIAQLPGHPPFVVHVPGAESTTGVLRIGALPSDPTAFTTYALSPFAGGPPLHDGTPAWNDVAVPTCVDVEPTNASYCLPSLWDTGDPTAYIAWPGEPSPYVMQLPLGSAVNITLGPNTPAPVSYGFLVGPDPTPGVDLVVVEPGGGQQPYINPGIGLFFHYDALFDQERGVVGLAANGAGDLP